MFTEEDLSKTFVRAKVDGEWKAVTLEELLEKGNGDFVKFAVSRIIGCAGLSPGVEPTKEQAVLLCRILEAGTGVFVKPKGV